MPAPIAMGAAAIAARLAAKKAAQELAKKKAKSQVGVSVRSKSVDTGTKRMVTKQNKAAESYKIKDLDKLEKGQKLRAEKKIRDAAARKAELKKAETKGLVKGATATAGLGVAGLSAKLAVASKDKKESKKKGKK
jgi:hypothetical protein